jgi:tRNA(adenine34) deaminase
MQLALQEAHKAGEAGEIPVGAVIVAKDNIIARAHNLTEKLTDVTAHAEILAITSAEHYLGSKVLQDCTLYVTLEPCVMCAGAIYWSQISRVVIGASDSKRGYTHFSKDIIHKRTEIVVGVLENECSELLKDFFVKLRKRLQ